MLLKNQTARQNDYKCAWCGKSFSRTQIIKSNGLDVCKACDATLKRKEGGKLAKKKKASSKTSTNLDKAQNATDAAGALVTLAGAAITVIQLLSKKK